MVKTKGRSRGVWLATGTFAFWAIAVSLLRYAYPVYFDGGGPMPSFFYRGHLPDLVDYNQHHWQYDLRFLLPYCIAALILTVVCLFIAPKLSNRLIRRHSVRLYALASLVLIFAVAAASDVVNIVWLTNGMFYGGGVATYIRFLAVGLPLAITSAVFAAFIERWPTRVHN